jgi:hypothetical protein
MFSKTSVLLFALFAMSMAQNFPRELSGLDYGALIGGPLSACVDAQADAAMTTVDFIQNVGFDEDGEIRTVSFEFDTTVNGTDVHNVLTVPFLTIIPIPVLEIEICEINFSAKLGSTTTRNTESKVGFQSSLSVSGGLFVRAKFSASFSLEKKTTTGHTVSREYSQTVHVIARQANVPYGLEKALSLIEEAITVQRS